MAQARNRNPQPAPTTVGRNGPQQRTVVPVLPEPIVGPAPVHGDRRRSTASPSGRSGFVNFLKEFGGGLEDAWNNPIINPTGWAVKTGANFVDDKLGVDASGYIQDPLGQGLDDLGAPDAVQFIANPTGYATRRAVNADTGYGLNVPRIGLNGIEGVENLSNDVNNTIDAGKDVVDAVGNIPGYVEDLFTPRAAGTPVAQPAGTAAPPITSAAPDQYRTDALNPDIRSLLDAERRKGPSEAEALLLKATDRAASQALGIAAGARGGAGARERAQRQAISSNAAMGSTASADVAALRAREEADRRNRQATIMQLLQNNAAAGDTRDLGYEQSASGERSSANNVAASIGEDRRQFDITRADAGKSTLDEIKEDPLGWLSDRLLG